ncbi:transposable element Tcb2 transposase [Trichonephila clavipes]|nr:transposable element Tcb2 transposase [Trichonephila clavipes]
MRGQRVRKRAPPDSQMGESHSVLQHRDIDRTPHSKRPHHASGRTLSLNSSDLHQPRQRVIFFGDGRWNDPRLGLAVGVKDFESRLGHGSLGVKNGLVTSGVWNCFLETGSAGRRPGQGRRRATTPNEDRYLVLTAWKHRNMNATLLQQHLRSATGTTVSTQTVRNRLNGVGLYARRSMVCVRLTSRHCRNRNRPSGQQSIVRGSRNNPAFVHESVRFGGGEVLVYGGYSIDGRTGLYTIRDGPLTARRYRDEILRSIVVPYAAAIGDDFILMDDNSRPHCGKNCTNGMASVFSRHESNRAHLGLSKKTSCWPPTTLTNSPRTGKSSSGRVGQNTPIRD